MVTEDHAYARFFVQGRGGGGPKIFKGGLVTLHSIIAHATPLVVMVRGYG